MNEAGQALAKACAHRVVKSATNPKLMYVTHPDTINDRHNHSSNVKMSFCMFPPLAVGMIVGSCQPIRMAKMES
ncbi:hypothetical protein SIO17_14495 [Pseudoalteromonas piscicida]|uniref:Uncharacterized protein n=1 Tax=Pseudoalteromonas piscicida TaxID=43662 RepID=A0ABN5CFP7_PSEO7|nr:hypothetical protein [Pseudoalteromonas piscicida]ATD08265.1 hypothetical protein PPIS_a3481 [Pseudoalteromonas piscicida]WPU30316.1 hypothetical protein SIO17_14495 [Pseudoalteromonas piscicida]